MSTKQLLITADPHGGFIHACPYCHRYVKCEAGIRVCLACYGEVDNDKVQTYRGKVYFDGGQSWRKRGRQP